MRAYNEWKERSMASKGLLAYKTQKNANESEGLTINLSNLSNTYQKTVFQYFSLFMSISLF